jgi:hypothetical protein
MASSAWWPRVAGAGTESCAGRGAPSLLMSWTVQGTELIEGSSGVLPTRDSKGLDGGWIERGDGYAGQSEY